MLEEGIIIFFIFKVLCQFHTNTIPSTYTRSLLRSYIRREYQQGIDAVSMDKLHTIGIVMPKISLRLAPGRMPYILVIETTPMNLFYINDVPLYIHT